MYNVLRENTKREPWGSLNEKPAKPYFILGDAMTLINTAIILAGGKSTRMGFDKQLIKMGNITITEYIIKILKPLFENIIVVTNKLELYEDNNIVTAEDIYKGYGPIAGIHAGLLKSKSIYNYIIACFELGKRLLKDKKAKIYLKPKEIF